MNPIEFKEQNIVLNKPPEMTREQCISLPAWKGKDVDGTPLIISKWQPTAMEIEAIARGEPIWLGCVSLYHPPVFLTTENPFEPVKAEVSNG